MPSDERKVRDHHQGDVPSDSEALAGETAASEPLTARRGVQPAERAARGGSDGDRARRNATDEDTDPAEQLGHS